MKRRYIIYIVLIVFIFIVVPYTNAIMIDLVPDSQIVRIGNQADVNLKISGLGNGLTPSLSTFDLNISYNLSILSFNHINFGDPLLGDQLDLFGLGAIKSSNIILPGVINLFELSLDQPQDINLLQSDSFILATLTFDTLSIGMSSLDISVNAIGDAWGDPLILDAPPKSGSINVSAIPEPNSILLLISGIFGSCCFYFKRKTS